MQFALLIYESPQAFATRNNAESDRLAGLRQSARFTGTQAQG